MYYNDIIRMTIESTPTDEFSFKGKQGEDELMWMVLWMWNDYRDKDLPLLLSQSCIE